MEKLAANDRISKAKVLEITNLLRLEVERNEENGRAMECLEVRTYEDMGVHVDAHGHVRNKL